MALKGDLQDISLANLVQMLCLDRRKAALVLKHPPSQQGVIFFDQGQIIHAEVGSLVGEEAVYHLLSWGHGVFEMNDQRVHPHQTITAPWNHLLMEGMRLLDEQNLPQVEEAQPVAPLSPAQIEQDDTLENDLVLLLSRLEQMQIRLADARDGKQPVPALHLLTEIVNQVAEFAEKLPAAGHRSGQLADILAQAAETYATARLLRVTNNRLSARIVAQLYSSWTGDIAERKQTFKEISHSLLIIIEKYFLHIINRFHAAAVAGQWQETSEIYLAELKREVNNIQF